jgi:chromosomal replication initiator protein
VRDGPAGRARPPESEMNAPRSAPPARGNDVAQRTNGATRLRGELDTFVVGPSNELAFASARAIVREPLAAISPLVLYGPPGLGKTHLLHGICNAVRRTHPQLEWRYVSGEEFTNEYIYALQHNRIDAFRARFRSVDVLAIDDIHFLASKKSTQDEFLHTFNAIDACGKTVVLSSDRHPRAIADLSEPLINRLVAGIVVTIDPPDLPTRKAILQRRAALMRATIPGEVLDWIAEQIVDNVRELEGALYKLVALAGLNKDLITLALARAGLADEIARRPRPIDAAAIERVITTYFGVSGDRLRSSGRDRTVSLARGLLMYLLRRHTRMSSPEIGRLLGGKNHSTVLMAKSRIDQTLAANGAVTWKTPQGEQRATLSELLESLEQELRRPRL